MEGNEKLQSHGLWHYWNLLKNNKGYRLLLTAHTISWFGDWFNYIATLTVLGQVLGWTTEQTETSFSGSGLPLALFLALRLLPPFILMPITGVVADTFDRLKVMMTADLLRAIVVLCLIFVRNRATLWLLYVLIGLQYSLSAFFDPCREGLVPTYVRKDDLVAANTVDAIFWSATLFVGASAGGFVVTMAGTNVNYIIDSVSFLGSFFCLWRLRVYTTTEMTTARSTEIAKLHQEIKAQPSNESSNVNINTSSSSDNAPLLNDQSEQNSIQMAKEKDKTFSDNIDMMITENFNKEMEVVDFVPRTEPNKESFFKKLKGALLFFRKNRYIFALTFLKGSGSIEWGALEMCNVRLAAMEFPIGSSSNTLGLLSAIVGVSVGIGPILADIYFTKTLKMMHYAIVGNYLSRIVGILLVAWSPNVFPFFVGNIIRGACGGVNYVFSASLLQQTTPDEFRGRVFAFDYGIAVLAEVLSTLIGGVLFDVAKMTTREVAVVFAILMVIPALWSLVYFILVVNTKEVSEKYKLFEFAVEISKATPTSPTNTLETANNDNHGIKNEKNKIAVNRS
jgi:MFS family permease